MTVYINAGKRLHSLLSHQTLGESEGFSKGTLTNENSLFTVIRSLSYIDTMRLQSQKIDTS